MPPIAFFESFNPTQNPSSYSFEEPIGEIRADAVSEVIPALRRVEEEIARGRHCAGFLSYEAAPGLDPALKTHPPSAFPLVWFGVFALRREIQPGALDPNEAFSVARWDSSVDADSYRKSIDRIRNLIAAGETYQVNYTFRGRSRFQGSERGLYRTLCCSQRTAYCGFLDLGRFVVLSASPELFFSLRDGEIVTRPMKGTARRGRWSEEDEALGDALAQSAKNRAENVMIVDLMRNDLGRVAQTGSVHVPALFTLERYETVWQLTSTVRARLRREVDLPSIFQAVFPSGSVTGAPKIHTMEIIRELESTPRGLYTGCVGYVSPGPEMLFNVAIRTIVIDRQTGVAEFGVGGGITFDSDTDGEFAECEIKTRFLSRPRPEFRLFETLRYDPAEGFFLLDRHLARMRQSAAYFGFLFNSTAAVAALDNAARSWPANPHRTRLLLDRHGRIEIESEPITPPDPAHILRVRIDDNPIDSSDPFLFHKTTNRAVYDTRAAAHPEADDVLLVNERGEVTESTRANIVAEIGGYPYTPPVDAGLLPGTFRAELLARREIVERTLLPEHLRRSTRLFLINSVRAWMPVTLVD